MKILVCFGTRPEAIKMATLIHQLKNNARFEVKVCITAQHREMLDQVLDFFEIVPDYDLNIMKSNQSLNELTGRIFLEIDKVFDDFLPDFILVHGDTTTSTVCALAAFHRNINIGHIEAGLRTFQKFSPFPEELNRTLTTKIADLHFAPTEEARNNLVDDKISTKNIVVTGNTVIDSLYWTIDKINSGFSNAKIDELSYKLDLNKKIILITTHRRENFGEGLEKILKSIKNIANHYPDCEIVFPVHLNPKVKTPVYEMLSGVVNVKLLEPLDYPSFIWLMSKSYIILTDSGGIQEEAPSLGKPVLVLRNTTERPEAIAAGTVILVGTDEQKIIENINSLMSDPIIYNKMSKAHNPYGDGNANERIIEFIVKNEEQNS